jgi:hypothetical protein
MTIAAEAAMVMMDAMIRLVTAGSYRDLGQLAG